MSPLLLLLLISGSFADSISEVCEVDYSTYIESLNSNETEFWALKSEF